MRLARIGTGGALAVLVLTGTFGGCGGGDDGAKEIRKQEELRQARTEGARQERIRDLKRRLREQKKPGKQSAPSSPAPPPSGSGSPPSTSGSTSCGGGLSVGPNTSCPFAEAVRADYPGSSNDFEVYSSTTGKTYTMSCTTSSPHVCKGGNGASVYFP